MKLTTYLFLVLFLVADACIEPYDAKIPDGERPLVVDGLITDQPGPYEVRIYKSTALNNPYDKVEWLDHAKVTIFDDLGNSELLNQSTIGHYKTTAFQGVVGRSYYIRIETSGDDVYESIPEKIVPVGDFSNLQYQFIQEVPYEQENQLNPKNGFKVFLDAEVLPEQEGLVRWRWSGTFEFKSYPELRKRLTSGAVQQLVPDPPQCSGWIVRTGSINPIKTGPCVCCFCWVNQYNDSPLLSDKRFVNNGQINQYNVAFIPANKRYFFDKYYLDIEQMSVSPTVYAFWKKVGDQQMQGSDLFQTPAAKTTGNIVSLTEGAIPAIGVFGASAVKTQSFILYPGDIPYEVQSIDTVAESCLTVYRFSSTTKPTFW